MGNRRCRIFFLVFTLIANALDFISDWLFYISAKRVESGLVYGPVDSVQVTALLVFSIVGSVGFVIEIAVFIFELRKGDDYHGDLLLDLISAIIIWVEDIPQIGINLSIALCREEAISIFQLTKAGLVLVGVVINIISTIVRFCRKYDTQSKVCGVRICLFFGILIEGCFAAAIFFLTQTEPNTNGDVSFRVPTTVIHEHLNDDKYLSNVNLFVHHADLFDGWNMDTNKKDSTVNWLRLFSVYDLKEQKVASFKLKYEHLSVQLLYLAVWVASSRFTPQTEWTLSACYSLNQQTAQITRLTTQACANEEASAKNDTETFYIKFRFEDPDSGIFYRKRLFGEIFFNLKVFKNGVCSDGNFEDPSRNGATLYYPLTFHYFRINTFRNLNDSIHLHINEFNMTRFYNRNSQDLTDVSEVWKTGWNKCDSSGSAAPVLDRNIELTCD